MSLFARHAETVPEGSLLWRIAVLLWAAKRALARPGDFVEAGAYRGTTAHILYDYLDFSTLDRRYYLYDLFDAVPEAGQQVKPHHGPALYDEVRARFSACPNVAIVKGSLPGSLDQAAPERIALLHIDLNNADAELGVLEALYDRVADGAAIVLDDYGWIAYEAQKRVADAFFAARQIDVLELPTGQGLVIK
jgi:hypothetical protein